MIRILTVLAAALFAGHAVAAEYGIGVSAKSDNGVLYFPIDISQRLRIEPHLRYLTSDTRSESGISGTVFRSESDSLEVGVGLFGLAVPKESVRLYYGARASYFDGDSQSSSSRQSFNGYRLAPTIGFEYLFNHRFTLGGEVGYYFEDQDIESSGAIGDSEFEIDRSGTESFLILRYFF